MLSVVFFLWSDPKWRNGAYTMDHVVRARNMVDRNLKIPHRFVLVTDEAANVPADFNYVPINKELLKLGRCWATLMLFSLEARELFGERLLKMDLDQVTVDDMDPLITDDEFRITAASAKGMHYNGSMILLKTGTRDHVYNSFDPSQANKLVNENRIGASDQYWYGKCLGPNEKTWTEQDGVYSFRHINPPDVLPDNARIVFFSGNYDPSQPALRQHHRWIKDNWQ